MCLSLFVEKREVAGREMLGAPACRQRAEEWCFGLRWVRVPERQWRSLIGARSLSGAHKTHDTNCSEAQAKTMTVTCDFH